MAENKTSSLRTTTSTTLRKRNTNLCSIFVVVPVIIAIAALLIYQPDHFDPAPFPTYVLTTKKLAMAPKINSRMVRQAEFIGSGQLLGPEDMAYEPRSRVMYTGCVDGWIKRVKLSDSGFEPLVEEWVNTGGRPLGIAIASHADNDHEVVVADAYKGLLKITLNKETILLTSEAEGQKFKLTDGVDIARDDTIYFTDASYKYGFKNYLYDILEFRPYGRLLSFNPTTKQTKVLLKDLYFPNGVAVCPDQKSLIFCETPLKRCRRYWLEGSRKGTVEAFIDNLPGFPDNIHSDLQNNFWIAISSWLDPYSEKARNNLLVRKALLIIDRFLSLRYLLRNGGILGVDIDGNPTVHIYDPAISMISSAIRVEDQLYIGSLHYEHIIRFNLSSS